MIGTMLRVKTKALAALALILTASPLRAELTVQIADDGSDRMVLGHESNEFDQQFYVTTLVRDGTVFAPLLEKVQCETVGSKSLLQARSNTASVKTYVAQYNMVNLWMGNLCHGKSDVMPKPEEAKTWLLDLAHLLPGSDAPLLRTRQMLVELYLFGAPGAPPDYQAALAILNEEAKPSEALAFVIPEARTHVAFAELYLSYVYEHGLGVAPDQQQARNWLQRALDAGNLDAEILSAQAKELGGGIDNEAEAFRFYMELSNIINPPLWFRLGLMYLEGRGTTKDPCKARDWLQKAADHHWNPVPQAKKYLDRIREENLCPAGPAVPARAAAGGIRQAPGLATRAGLATRVTAAPARGLIQDPVRIFSPRAHYPKSGTDPKFPWPEKLEIVVGANGAVQGIHVVVSLGPDFDREAIAAVKQWKFQPATEDGKPIALKIMVEVSFER